ncbi:MAG: acetylglutamate kinase [Dehalococcoidia bacterium]|nr:acetylglutamate kinase [Dehalococcoidia bacterium]
METKRPIIVKIGGSTLGSHDTTLEDMVTLQRRGLPLVVVHGGGNRVTEWLRRQGTPTSFVGGLRVTDERSLEMVAAVLGGLVNADLVAAVNSLGGRAIGMTGIDGNLIEGKIENAGLGYVGRIVKVNTKALEAILAAGFIPFIAPPCARSAGETANVPYLNVNGDEIAGELAAAMSAQSLIFLTDVEGIRDRQGSLLHKLTAGEVKSLLASGVIAGGMIPKAEAALTALNTTPLVQIADGRLPHALIGAVAGKMAGTIISTIQVPSSMIPNWSVAHSV